MYLVDPRLLVHVHVVHLVQAALPNAFASSFHWPASRVTVAGERPAADPQNRSNASVTSPLGMPCRYNHGSPSAS